MHIIHAQKHVYLTHTSRKTDVEVSSKQLKVAAQDMLAWELNLTLTNVKLVPTSTTNSFLGGLGW